jgi:hypothetical protein
MQGPRVSLWVRAGPPGALVSCADVRVCRVLWHVPVCAGPPDAGVVHWGGGGLAGHPGGGLKGLAGGSRWRVGDRGVGRHRGARTLRHRLVRPRPLCAHQPSPAPPPRPSPGFRAERFGVQSHQPPRHGLPDEPVHGGAGGGRAGGAGRSLAGVPAATAHSRHAYTVLRRCPSRHCPFRRARAALPRPPPGGHGVPSHGLPGGGVRGGAAGAEEGEGGPPPPTDWQLVACACVARCRCGQGCRDAPVAEACRAQPLALRR